MMLLQRHFLKEFLKLFAIVGAGLSTVITLLDLVREIDDLMPHNPSTLTLLLYAALNFPRYFLYVMPAAALLCSLYTVGHAARLREITAVMAAGGRVKRLLLPMVFTGVVLSLMGFAIGEFAVPACSGKAREIKGGIAGDRSRRLSFKDEGIWLRADDGSIVKIDFYVEETDTLMNMSIFKLGKRGIEEIMAVREASYSDPEDAWLLKDVRRYDTETGAVERVAQMSFPHIGPPKTFKEGARKPYEMGVVELRKYIKTLEGAGFRNPRLEVDMASKLSYPVVSLFMVLLGVSFPSRRGMGGLVSTAVGLVVSLLYWLGYTMSLSMGYAGIVPPVVAAWAMPAVFAAVSSYFFSRIPE